jgi:dephospho-CoA kinase
MTNPLTVIALTGGIGSGKSAVAKLFESWGAAVVDADLLAREVVEPGSQGLTEVQKAFPSEPLILADGSLNRPKLASIIFSDPTKKKQLESILHPRIRRLWLDRLAALKSSSAPVIVYVVPLFFESSTSMPELEKIVLVSAPDQLRIDRIMARDGFTQDVAELRLKAQLPQAQKIARSDFVIENDGTLELLAQRAKVVFDQLTNP